MIKRRYPGMHQFESDQRQIFFGREQEIKDVVNLIQLEKIAVLHGSSGLGKSSLLKAGVMPALCDLPENRRYAPLYIRFGINQGGDQRAASDCISPLQIVGERLDDCIEKDPLFAPNPDLDFLLSGTATPRLWHQFKRLQTGQKKRFVIIFDQFEEFSTYHPAQQVALIEQLAEAVFSEMPQGIFDRFHSFSESQQQLLSVPMEVHLLFTIRTDRLGIFESMKSHFSSILEKRYELKGLRWKQAELAIRRPATLNNAEEEPFASPPFEFDISALEKIHTFFIPENAPEDTPIEAFQVQLICSHIEDKVIEGIIKDSDGNKAPNVRSDDLPDLENIIRSYYHRTLAKLSDNEREAASYTLEYGLIFKADRTEDSKRLSVDVAQLLKEYGDKGLTPDLLEKLENDRLLRREALRKDQYHIEISHDTLLAPILENREKREKAELLKQQIEQEAERERKMKELEAERREQARQLLEREQQLAREKKLVRRANLYFRLASALSIALVVAGIFNYHKTWNGRRNAGSQYLVSGNYDAAVLEYQRADSMFFWNYRDIRSVIDSAQTLQSMHDTLSGLKKQGQLLFLKGNELEALQKYERANDLLSVLEEKTGDLLEKLNWKKTDVENLEPIQPLIDHTRKLLKDRFAKLEQEGSGFMESGQFGHEYACSRFVQARKIYDAIKADDTLIKKVEFEHIQEKAKECGCPGW